MPLIPRQSPLIFLTPLVSMVAMLTVPAFAAVTLVENGQAKATILLPAETIWDRYAAATPEDIDAMARQRFPNATPEQLDELRKTLPKLIAKEAKRAGDDEKLAAEELTTYLEKISGAKLTTATTTPSAGATVVLGTELARKAGFGKDIDALDPHGYIIRTKGDQVIIAGRTARGTLYGVYALLESLGCRWVMPGEFGEIIPEQATISIDLDVTDNPSHPIQRYWWCTFGNGDDYPRWTLRNKGSFVRALGDPRIQQSHASQVPLAWGAKTDLGETVTIQAKEWERDDKNQIIRDRHGAPANRITVEKEVRRLPDDYYTLQNGAPNTHIPNMVNPKVWDLFTNFYNDYFYSRPLEDYASISAADGLVLDERPASRELDSNEYDWTMGAPTATDRMWFFHRRYLDRVTVEHPGRKFGVLVYANNMTPPRISKVHSAMALVFAPLGICPLHHVRDDNCKTNRAYHPWLKAWAAQARAAGAEMYYYDYFPIGYQWCNFILSPQWQIIGRNYPWFHEMGLDGHTTQGFDDSAAMGLTAYVALRLYWDVNQDYNDIVQEYCQVRFGEQAADAMHAYYKVFEERMDNVPDITSNEIWGNHIAIDGATRAKAREALTKANPLIEGERASKHFATVVLFQEAMDAWCDGIDYARETGEFATAAAKMERAFEIRDELNTIYSHFVNPDQTKKDSIRRYQAGGWYHKYFIWDKILKESKTHMILPREMKVALDSDNLAQANGWQKPDVSVDQLEEWDTTVVPDVKYNTQREPAAYFYRTDVDVPATFANSEKVALFFPSVIARAMQVWINGEPITFDHGDYTDETWRGPSYFWMNYNHSQMFDVTEHLKPGQRNTIAFRIFKSFDHGGTYDRVFLLANPPTE